MGPKSMPPVLGIVDDCDRPEARMVVVVVGNPDRPQFEYLSTRIPARGRRGRMSSFPCRFTPLSAFGASATFEDDGIVQITAAGKSDALYPDGKPRAWQGRQVEKIDLRPRIAGHVLKAIRASDAAPDRLEEVA